MSVLLALVVATAVLVLIPGPNVALIVANSLKYGFRLGVVTVLGTTAGVALQLAAVVVGMAALVESAADVLTWIKWAGVAYLIVLGVRTWRESADDLASIEAVPVLFWRGCLIAALNPKTLLFHAAFIPQFVASGTESLFEFALVASVFLAVLFLGDVLWAAFADSARRVLGRYSSLRNRLTGAFFTAAGIGLALARK
jgi:threonine/homoserine/homoserine lactone efflux protein